MKMIERIDGIANKLVQDAIVRGDLHAYDSKQLEALRVSWSRMIAFELFNISIDANSHDASRAQAAK